MKRQMIQCQPSAKLMDSISATDFKVLAKADGDGVELLIFDGIGKDPWTGEGVGAKDVATFLADNSGKPVTVRLNSPGGFVWDGISIHNSLVQHDAEVITTVEGVAASAASLIAMAGNRVRMFANSTMMIHRAWALGFGNSKEMLDLADFLDKIDGTIAATYAAKTGRKAETMLKLMDGDVDGTWFTAAEAKDAGLADEIIALPKNQGRAKNDLDPRERVRTAMENHRRIQNCNAAARLRTLQIGKDGG